MMSLYLPIYLKQEDPQLQSEIYYPLITVEMSEDTNNFYQHPISTNISLLPQVLLLQFQQLNQLTSLLLDYLMQLTY